MSDDSSKQASDADKELEREIREGRKFTLEEAIGRMAGPGAMKGESPITRLQQAQTKIASWLRNHLGETGGGLQLVLERNVNESDLLLKSPDRPLAVLSDYCQRVVDSEYFLKEIVRNADVEWGRFMDERPYFEREGSPSHPDDPYTIESVRKTLSKLIEQLALDDD